MLAPRLGWLETSSAQLSAIGVRASDPAEAMRRCCCCPSLTSFPQPRTAGAAERVVGDPARVYRDTTGANGSWTRDGLAMSLLLARTFPVQQNEAGRVSDELSPCLLACVFATSYSVLLIVLCLAVRFILAAGAVAIGANRCAQTRLSPCRGVGSEADLNPPLDHAHNPTHLLPGEPTFLETPYTRLRLFRSPSSSTLFAFPHDGQLLRRSRHRLRLGVSLLSRGSASVAQADEENPSRTAP